MNSIQNYGMTNYKTSVNKQNNVSFGARFRPKDIEILIKDASSKSIFPELPQLYTFLERLDEIKPGVLAALVPGDEGNMYFGGGSHTKIKIGEDVFYENGGGGAENRFYDFLKTAILDGTKYSLKMPVSIYEQKIWEHRNVTADDIRNNFTYRI